MIRSPFSIVGTSASSTPVWQAISLAKLAFPSICTFLGSLGRYFFNKLRWRIFLHLSLRICQSVSIRFFRIPRMNISAMAADIPSAIRNVSQTSHM